MERTTIVTAAALAFVAMLPSAPASALNTRSFISANGLDSNSCARTAPCRTLQVAHDKTVAGGEINMLDPAGYGPVTITKSISIVNDGVGSAGVLVPSGATGIAINAGVNDKVNIHGLIIEGAGLGSNGISVISAQSVTIQNCIVRNLVDNGIALRPNSSSVIAVSDTYVANNGAAGILMQPTGSGISVAAVFNRVEAYSNSADGLVVTGFSSTGFLTAAVTDSVFAYNTGNGIKGFSEQGKAGTFVGIIRSTTFLNTGAGATAGTNATMHLGQSTFTANAGGPWSATGSGDVRTYQDNYMDGAAGPPLNVGKS